MNKSQSHRDWRSQKVAVAAIDSGANIPLFATEEENTIMEACNPLLIEQMKKMLDDKSLHLGSKAAMEVACGQGLVTKGVFNGRFKEI